MRQSLTRALLFAAARLSARRTAFRFFITDAECRTMSFPEPVRLHYHRWAELLQQHYTL